MNVQIVTDNSSITKPASRVMLGGILSLIGSLASNVVVAYIYGAGSSMDAYLTAIVIPSYLQIVFFSSLAFVVIPIFIEAETTSHVEDAWALVGTFFWLTAIALLLISILGAVFSRVIIELVAPGFQDEKSALASQMLSILIFTIPFIGLSTLTAGIQNARHRYFWPSVAPAFGSLINVVILVTLSPILGSIALCWGYLLAMVVQSGFSIIPVFSHGWKRLLPLTDERVQMAGRSMVPLILFGLFTCISPVALRYFSSTLPDGQIAYMGYANKISSIFVVLLASGIAASIFPTMARTFAQDGISGLSQKSDFGLRLTFAVALPAIMIVNSVAIPLISVFFERGAFSHSDTYGVGRILLAFLVGEVLIRMIANVFERGFYTLKNTFTPPIVGAFFVILFIATARFFVTRWGYVGIVWANVIRQGLDALTMGTLLFAKFPKGNAKNLIGSIMQYFMAAFASFLCGRLVLFTLASSSVYIQLALGGFVGVLLYFLILYFIDRKMLASIFEMFGILRIFASFEARVNLLSQRMSWLVGRSRQ